MFRQINPFIYGGPVPPSHFIGRDEEVDTIMSRLVSPVSGSSAVTGEAQIGKTSLLRYISSPQVLKRWELEPSQDIFVEIDCQILSPFSPLLFWQMIFRLIQQKVKGTDLEEKIKAASLEKDIAALDLIALFQNITDSKRLIVLLDEFEWVVTNIDPDQPNFFNTLRALVQLPRLALVTATRAPLETLTSQISFVDTRFPRAFAPIELGPFSREEANELIYRALQDKRIFDEDDRQFVYEVSKGHPYWLQNACFKLFQRKTSHGTV
jgi:AAA+ ATPase superfamily predicted ATPase